ncbi:DNA-binding FadR family transcriptional regulator [Subtercola boreus]|nr:DNA-binding FadR family transcriptional regulator [Subtercola boreus]
MAEVRGVSLGPIQVPRASDVLATTLREQILSGQFAQGEALPSERELIEYTQMSRTTVREALRMLESQGFVEMRTGRSGGPFARRPGSQAVEQSVRFAIQGEQTSETRLRETRQGVEPACAGLAAKYRTDEDLVRIDAATAAVDVAAASGSAEAFVLAKLEWHLAVSVASHNSLLIGFFKALATSIHEMADAGTLTDDLIAQTAAHHGPVVEAIRAQDVAAAESFMRSHIMADRHT